jgi:hypothetical protein
MLQFFFSPSRIGNAREILGLYKKNEGPDVSLRSGSGGFLTIT